MHYERHLIQQTVHSEMTKSIPYPMQQPTRPVNPMSMPPNYNPYAYNLYRPGFMPYPGYAFPNPSVQGIPNQIQSQEKKTNNY